MFKYYLRYEWIHILYLRFDVPTLGVCLTRETVPSQIPS